MATIDETVNSEKLLKFKIIFSKKIFEESFEPNRTVSELKQRIHSLTSVVPDMQKLILKGKSIQTRNDETLVNIGLKDKDKILLIGSTLLDVSAAILPVPNSVEQNPIGVVMKEMPFCKQIRHKKFIDRGVPEDAIPGYRNGDEPVPLEGLKGVVNQFGKKCRIRFKLESDECWICSDAKTSKYSISQIEGIEDQPIEGREEYSIVVIRMESGLKLWFYWIPQQFVKALRNINK